MTPESHTLYSVMLFLALASLNLWSKRHYRTSQYPTGGKVAVLPPRLFQIFFRPKPIFHLHAMPASALLPVGVCQGGDLFICRRNAWSFYRFGSGDRFGPKAGTVGSSEE